jgi:hypothetical protein
VSTQERIDVADGKYTVVYDNGQMSALRHGEPWRDINGDNLVYWLAVELRQARENVQALLRDLGDAVTTLRAYEASHNAKAEAFRKLQYTASAAEAQHKADVNAALAARFQATIVKIAGA